MRDTALPFLTLLLVGCTAGVEVGDLGMIAVSQDAGRTWSTSTHGMVGFGSVAHEAGAYVVLGSKWNGDGFDTNCVVSRDATTWEACPLNSSRFISATAADGLLIVSMDEGIAHTSDGENWTTLEGSYPGRIFHSEGEWVGERSGMRWTSTGLESGWTSERHDRGFRAMAAGWVTP